MTMTRRYAMLKNDPPQFVAPYLYGNFKVETATPDGGTIISGVDHAGFTMDAVLERLASGLRIGSELRADQAPNLIAACRREITGNDATTEVQR